jgi:hypothetical protein
LAGAAIPLGVHTTTRPRAYSFAEAASQRPAVTGCCANRLFAAANRKYSAPCSICFASRPLEPNVNFGVIPVRSLNSLPTSSNAARGRMQPRPDLAAVRFRGARRSDHQH